MELAIKTEEQEHDVEDNYLTTNDFPNICRCCLSREEELQEFEGLVFDDDTPLIDFCSNITGVQVRDGANLPNKICSICIDQLSQVYLYVKQFKANDLILRSVGTSEEVLVVYCDEFDEPDKDARVVETTDSDNSVKTDKIKCKCGQNKEKRHNCTLFRYSCHICKKRFKMKYRLKVHYIVHSKETPYECNICSKRFKFSHNLTRHKISHAKILPFDCQICKKTFTRRTARDEHVRNHNRDERLSCEQCRKSFQTLAGYEYHKKRHKMTSGEAPVRTYTCSVCNKDLSSKWTLRTHMMIHTGERRFLCNICGKSFITKAALISHSRVHSGDKPFQCLLCPKNFTQRSSLVIHTATHSGLKPYKCDLCSKMFSQRAHLTVHKQLHTGQKPYICNYCGKGFSLNGNLKVHTRIHTATKHTCLICGFVFCDKVRLRNHMLIKHAVYDGR